MRRVRVGPLVVVLMVSGAFAQTPVHHTGIVHTADVDLGYETYGQRSSALSVIAVNGGPGLSHAYMVQNDMWKKVAASRLVMLYDQRGLGASKHIKPGALQTMDAQVADLDAVRSQLGLQKAAFVGDSYGGMLAMAYAAAHPEHVAKLVLSDSAAPSWKTLDSLLAQTYPDIEAEDAAEEKKLAGDKDAAARVTIGNHFRMVFYSPATREAYVAHMGDLGFEPAVAEAVSQATQTLDLWPKLAGFAFPTLVITGRHDAVVAPVIAWRIAHTIPGAQLVFFEQSGHLPAYEEPEKYRTVLENFLNQR